MIQIVATGSPCIMVCSTVGVLSTVGVFSTVGGYHEYSGGYYEYRRGTS